MKVCPNQLFLSIGANFLLGVAAGSADTCPIEAKLLLSASTTPTVIASLGFQKQAASRVYFFDTESLALLRRGVIVRIRQGANDDLTVKVRIPETNPLPERDKGYVGFPCEIDRTEAGASTSYAVGRRYRSAYIPENGQDIVGLLSPAQKKLLDAAHIPLDWPQITRVADIDAVKWQTAADSSTGMLSLERWQWPTGEVLEISAKAGPGQDSSRYAELRDLVRRKGLALNANQETKTTMVLNSLVIHAK